MVLYLLYIVCLSACVFICLSFCDALSLCLLAGLFFSLSLSLSLSLCRVCGWVSEYMGVRGGGGGQSVTALSSVKAQMCLHLDVQC